MASFTKSIVKFPSLTLFIRNCVPLGITSVAEAVFHKYATQLDDGTIVRNTGWISSSLRALYDQYQQLEPFHWCNGSGNCRLWRFLHAHEYQLRPLYKEEGEFDLHVLENYVLNCVENIFTLIKSQFILNKILFDLPGITTRPGSCIPIPWAVRTISLSSLTIPLAKIKLGRKKKRNIFGNHSRLGRKRWKSQ